MLEGVCGEHVLPSVGMKGKSMLTATLPNLSTLIYFLVLKLGFSNNPLDVAFKSRSSFVVQSERQKATSSNSREGRQKHHSSIAKLLLCHASCVTTALRLESYHVLLSTFPYS